MRNVLLSLLAAAVLSAPDRSAGSPADHRHGRLTDLNGPFAFTPPDDRGAWEKRAAAVRQRLRVALGLHPWPGRIPMHPVVHGWRDFGDYRVAAVYFQSIPGHFVTGSLYLPNGVSGPVPGVLCPHGHWPDGRFMEAGDNAVQRELESGAETDPEAARSPLQARCVHLARMGCAVFFFDMVGYADSIQIPASIAHGFRQQRPDMNSRDNWGFFSPQAESHAQSIMGLQTWNAIRALDFLAGLPEVDPERIGVTGASGGGTQTFILGAVDPRPAAIFPAVMVSGEMQGGCTCENACLLRIGTSNIEIAALFAPKPLGMTAADDWTKNMSTHGLPELQKVFGLFGAPDHVFLLNRTEFPHNYNLPSRLAMYAWMEKHLRTPRPAPAAESPFRRMKRDELTVWNADHPAPPAADPEAERSVLHWWSSDARQRIAANPSLVDEALPVLIGRTWEEAAAGNISWRAEEVREAFPGVLRIAGLLTHEGFAESVRCTFLHPETWNRRVLINIDANGSPDSPAEAVRKALADGTSVGWVELFDDPGPAPGTARRVEGHRDFAGYTWGYNHPPIARRAHDLMTVLAFIDRDDRNPERIDIECGEASVPETALALTQVRDSLVHTVFLPQTAFRFGEIDRIDDERLLPGAARYGDLPAIVERIRAKEIIRTR